MTLTTLFHSARRSVPFAAILLLPWSAYSQNTLTAAVQFSTNYSGSFAGPGDTWNTLAGDNLFNLWLALNPDATLPVNGPSDAQAGIALPLEVGNSYTYYIFGAQGALDKFYGLNLFFDGNNSTPGISVYGAVNKANFRANGGSTITMDRTPVMGSGSTFYSSGGAIVVQNGYDWNAPATPPGEVCQPFVFSPGSTPCFFGSITLQVYPAASLSLSQASSPPGTRFTATGSGFASTETVNIYAAHIGTSPLGAVTTDASGSFTATVLEPGLPYGPIDFFAVGLSSGNLGAARFSVTPTLITVPKTQWPGLPITAYALGFGPEEKVDVYWNNPRQLLGTVAANGYGTGILTITVPANASRGKNATFAAGETTKVIGIATVWVE